MGHLFTIIHELLKNIILKFEFVKYFLKYSFFDLFFP